MTKPEDKPFAIPKSMVPTVADRIAQVVVRSYLEPSVEPVFHPDSAG